MAINTYRELGIEIYVRYNNRKLMSGIILASGVDSDNIDKVIGVIDKLEKVSKEELYDMLREIGLKDEVIDKFLAFVEQNEWSFGGGYKTIIDGYYMNADGTRGKHVLDE